MAVVRSRHHDDSAFLLRTIAAYRERWDISGDAPLGPRPDQSADRAHHGDYKRLLAILNQPPKTNPTTTASQFPQPRTTPGRDP